MLDSLKNFEWKDIGDITKGRPTLGIKMYIASYRMFQYSLRNILEKKYGKDTVRQILIDAGRISGIEFCKNVLDINLPPDSFFDLLKQRMKDLEIGILQVIHADFKNMIFILTISEDLDCSGLTFNGETVCNYDEGLIIGILETYTGRQFIVKETNCWATGDWTCRFNIVAI